MTSFKSRRGFPRKAPKILFIMSIKYVSSKPMISCKSRRFLSKAPKTGHFPIDKIMYRGYYACTYENTYTILVY